ncbi:MAG: energy transducer TonB [Bacteroidota bacterium]|nr:energy transducer TonB [Bacteroidota bacterium]MEC8175521.1 energy transducer TonB [Bacteroidota bacterium]MEC8367547.1 energy transducer TonB [Bacteroidota bacterium]MEC8602002.1 energy transducer TonB [Bacteroidota bacterium]
MVSKKNPKADLNNKSSFYFAIGLFLVLFISWRAIEFKNWDDDGYGYIALDVENDDDEEIPITEQIKTPPPPPPPPAPEIIEIVEDEEEIEETIIESTETDQEEIVEEVEVVEEDLDLDVPFAIIEDVPLFPGCERVAKSKRRDCFQEKIQQHIRKNFRYPEIAQEMGIQGRVFVQFTISKDGSISGIRTRGPDKNLEKEADRIISKLPRMTPGKQRGRPVRVPFSVPITFKLQ